MLKEFKTISFEELYKNDRISFILESINCFERELQYGENMCHYFLTRASKNLEYYDWHYYNSIFSFIKALKKILEETKSRLLRLDTHFEDIEIKQPIYISSHTIKALHSILVSALQRKKHPIRYFTYSSFPSYTFSESHPAYPIDIEAIEKTNLAVFEMTNKLLQKFKFNVPFIALSTEKKYAYSFIPLIDKEEIKKLLIEYADAIKPENPTERLNKCTELINDFFSLSMISMPRWGPKILRFTPFIAHEQFHRIIELIDLCVLVFSQYCDRPGLGGKEFPEELEFHIKDVFSSVFGEGLYFLFEIRNKLSTSFLIQFPDDIFENIKEAGTKKIYTCNRSQHLTELLCDVGGTIIFGPAYMYAFNSFALYSPESQGYKFDIYGNPITKDRIDYLDFFNDDHPPDSVRLTLIAEILKHAGFQDLADSCLKELKDKKIIGEKGSEEYVKWVSDNKELFLDFAQTFCKYADIHLDLENNPSDESQEEFENKCKNIFNKAINNDFYLPEVNPTEVINAIWYKMRHKLSEEKLTLAWRLVIKHCSIRKFGRVIRNTKNGEISYDWRDMQ